MKQLIVAGISTEVGKTVISAMLVEGLQADYWKPVQSGDLHYGDTDKVRSWVNNSASVFHPEAFRLTEPMSPHAAADIDDVHIALTDFTLPQTENHLVVELAGGLMVPLNHEVTNVDLIKHLGLPVVLVANYYLGSINHSLLSLDLLKKEKIPCLGIVFNGKPVESTRDIILKLSDIPILAEIPQLDTLDSSIIHSFGQKIIQNLPQ